MGYGALGAIIFMEQRRPRTLRVEWGGVRFKTQRRFRRRRILPLRRKAKWEDEPVILCCLNSFQLPPKSITFLRTVVLNLYKVTSSLRVYGGQGSPSTHEEQEWNTGQRHRRPKDPTLTLLVFYNEPLSVTASKFPQASLSFSALCNLKWCFMFHAM